jgi:hypothetical protein
MTTTDWIIDIVLILIVVRQLRQAKLTRRFVIIPAAIVAYVAHSYLHGLPSGGNDLALVAVFTATGAILGLLGGLLTRVWSRDGSAYVQAGPAAAGLWVASMTARLGFIIWITHPSGEAAITRFSIAHGIHDASTWQTALVLLALAEVIVRIGLIVVRGVRATRISRTSADPITDNQSRLTTVR